MPRNPLHHATRVVRLPAEWTIPPRDLQVNYYNFLAKRLITSTDVIVGETRVYRTNALGCRGDDVPAGAAVLLVVGDDFVHGGPEGSFVELIEIDPAWPLNGGIEDLTLAEAVQRLVELSAELPVAGALFAPPRRGIGPQSNAETDLEARWTAEMDKLPNSAPLALLKPPRGAPTDASEGVAARFDAFLAEYAALNKLPLLDADAALKRSPLEALGRLVGKTGQDDRQRLARMVETAIGAKVRARAESTIRDAAAPASPQPSGHGPQDVGRTYPLW